MTQLKIGLIGAMRSGKDAVGAYLVKNHRFQRFAFGDGIREVCSLAGLTQDDSPVKPRAILQGVGQDLRKYEPDVWVWYCFKKIDAGTMPGKNIVITDVRQPNEVAALRDQGFILVRVNASLDTRINRIIEKGEKIIPEELYHETEQHVDKYRVNYELDNNGDLGDLYRQIEIMLWQLWLCEGRFGFLWVE